MTTATQDAGTTDLNAVRGGFGQPDRQAIEPGKYPIVELLGVENSDHEEYGKYTWIHGKVVEGPSEGDEIKIGIKRFTKEEVEAKPSLKNLATAKSISLASFLDIISGGEVDRNGFLARLTQGEGLGKQFGVELKLVGKSKQYTFFKVTQ